MTRSGHIVCTSCVRTNNHAFATLLTLCCHFVTTCTSCVRTNCKHTRMMNCHTDEIRRGFASPPNFAVDKNVRQQSTAPDGMCSGIPQTAVRLPHGECGVWGNAPREGVQGLAPDRVRGNALRVLGASRAIYGYLWVINRQQKSAQWRCCNRSGCVWTW